MRKPFNILLVILICALSMSACTTSQNRNQIQIPTKSSKTISMYYPRRIVQTPSEQFVERWESYMFDKYNQKVDLDYISKNEKTEQPGIDFQELTERSGTSGFIFLDDYSDLTELIKRDLIMPVNFYLESIKSFKNVNAEMTESFTDSNQNTWALPLVSDSLKIDKRTYNKEWLDKSGMPVPETIEEFYKYADFVANEDPDGNGIDDTYILDYTDVNLFYYLTDIFRAFGCYPDRLSPVSYNPGKMKFENMILNENFIDAMIFIKTLKDNGMIINKESANRDYRVASAYSSGLLDELVKERAYGYFLRGQNQDLLIQEKYSETCMAVLKYTESPGDKIEWFYNMIYSNTDSYMDFYFGIENENYYDLNDYYSTSHYFADKEYIGIYVTLNQIELLKKPIIDSSFEISREELKRIQETVKEVREADQGAVQYLGTNLSYRLPFDIFTEEVYGITRYTGHKEMISAILEGNSTVEDAIADYVAKNKYSIEKLNNLNGR